MTVTADQMAGLYRRIDSGLSVAESARGVGISTRTARMIMNRGNKSDDNSGGARTKTADQIESERQLRGPIQYSGLSPTAKKAWNDFGFFQLRYFGRIPIGWQTEAAERVIEWLETDDEEYVVVNAPPGSGKTVLFTHDIPAWLTVRNRAIRGQIGSATFRLAGNYINRLRRTFERTVTVKARADELDAGIAVDAKSTLARDFGRFKPLDNDLWTGDAFVVAQFRGEAVTEKEPTWSGYGADTGNIGNRMNFIIWDDLVDPKRQRTIEARDKLRDDYDDVMETRLEPNGLLVLQGQRLDADDLYRYALDKQVPELEDPETGEVLESRAKYHHIKFKAHYEELCENRHKRDAAAWPDGCLLSPRRIPWRKIQTLKANRGDRFEVLYQQEDVDAKDVLVPKSWVFGDGHYPGCTDEGRDRLELPRGLSGESMSVLTVDPSPTKFWAIEWWIYDPVSELRHLMDLVRSAMGAEEFLDYNHATASFSGLLEEMWQTSRTLGFPFSHAIVEINAAQRFMLQYEHVRRWIQTRSVELIPHSTHRNKSDPNYGIDTIAPHYQFGRVRLPYKRNSQGWVCSQRLIDEVTKYPKGRTDDCVMAQWFLEWQLPHISLPNREVGEAWRPSWANPKAVSA